MRVILWILGQPQTTKSSSAPKQATAVQGEAAAGFFRKSIKSTHSPTANLRIFCKKKQDSNQLAAAGFEVSKTQDSKILEIESGLSKETSANAERCPLFCKPRAEISLERLSHKRGAGIADSSPKAESSNYKKEQTQ